MLIGLISKGLYQRGVIKLKKPALHRLALIILGLRIDKTVKGCICNLRKNKFLRYFSDIFFHNIKKKL